jgi:hypothetical protein
MSNQNNALGYAVAAIVVIIIIAGGVYLVTKGKTSAPTTLTTTIPTSTTTISNSTNTTTVNGNSTSKYVVQMTDPPSVPNGTSAFIVTYSQVSLHEQGSANVITIPASGSVNVLALSGKARTVAIVQNTANATFNSATFTVASAQIVINGTAHNVTIPNPNVTASISGSSNTSTRGGVIISLQPAVVEVYNSSGSAQFTMSASAKALAVSSAQINATGGATIGLNTTISASESAQISALTNATITVSGVSIKTTGNSTQLTFTATNNGNSSAIIQGVMLSGYARQASSANASSSYSSSPMQAYSQGVTVGSNTSVSSNGVSSNTAVTANSTTSTNSTVKPIDVIATAASAINTTVMSDLHVSTATATSTLYVTQAQNFQNNYHNTLSFAVGSNSTLQLPHTTSQATASGYVIAPHTNATFTFSGEASLGSNSSVAVLIPNQTYWVQVISSTGVSAATSAKATAG